MVIKRHLERKILAWLAQFPAVALLGPRQCGKSTLASELMRFFRDPVYLDLEKASDHNKLQDAEAFFSLHGQQLICLDEIQRRPDLFPALRSILDENKRNGQILILGSASRELIRQSSESLAGRIGYLELTPFLLPEVLVKNASSGDILRRLWLRGGFPRSFLAKNDPASVDWRAEFIRTFLEQDLSQFGIRIAPETLRRFWQMCAHSHGQLWNASKLGASIGVSHTTVRSYLDALAQTFVLRVLPPHVRNLKKRIIKSPKVYLRDSGLLHALLGITDSGLLHALLGITSFEELLGHPAYGHSWEGFVIENVLAHFGPDWRAGFYQTPGGSELDLVLEKGDQRIAVECKASSAPQVSKGFWIAIEELKIQKAWVIAPVKDSYPLGKNAWVTPLDAFLTSFKYG